MQDSGVQGQSMVNWGVGPMAVAVLFCILIVAITWKKAQTYTVCNSAGCAFFARKFKASLNESAAHPCDNFTAFVCDGWTRYNKFSVRQDLMVNALSTLSKVSRAVQTTGKTNKPADGAMALFLSCYAVLQGQADQLLTVKRLLAAANITWPRRQSKPDVLLTLLYSSVKLRWSPLFNIDIDTSVDYGTEVFLMPFDDNQILRRKFKSLQGAAEGDRRAYFNFLSDKFGSTAAGEGDVTYEEVVNLCDAILVPLFDALQEQSTPEAINSSVLLQAKLTTSRWESALALHNVTGKPITYSTAALPYIAKFFELWNTYGENDTHLLVSWCTIQVAALYTNDKLIANYYGSEETALAEHGAFCLSKAYLVGKFSLFADYSSHVIDKDGRQDLERIAQNVRHAFHSRLQGWTHYEAVRTVVNDWHSVATVFKAFDASEGNGENDTHVDCAFGESLPDNWRKAAIPLKTMRSDKVYMAMKSLKLHVVLYDDFVLLPFSASFPLYDINATAAVNYGGVGKEMALSLSGLFYDTYWRFKQAKNSIVNVSKCIGGREALSNSLEVVAMNALYDAYMIASAGRDVRLVELEKYTSSEIFFIASCYSKCSGSMGSTYGDCNEALRHVEAFAVAFECPRNANMNPERPCRLF
ncbi:hypothetical protein HPB48_002716 [Haemaphysalis longicornis]|uniref:Peptidase M13 N-terminal domain-containing protein n=1 Tax=Haemaphysalis longicornis TaxID=44386 RepID=A0A9J6FZ21_HAELO|nr:hypothetical protein HPB48_002716 [Haemaphysalis longicornis]